jgi:RNA polymerase sigma-70 factor (ECF subfamily)
MLHAVAADVSVPHLEARTLDYAAIYDEHFDFVWRNVRRLGVPESSADDAVQDVFLVVHRKLAEFEGRSALRTWLFGILARVARDHRRARARYVAKTNAIAAEVDHESAPSPADLAAKREAARVLEEMLDAIDDDKREVFVLVELEQTSVADVAIALALNVNTAHARLRAGRQQFEAAVARFRAKEKK